MTTTANDKHPEINWMRCNLSEKHDHEKHYHAIGASKDGRTWLGTWIETDGEFSDIIDIEEN